MNRKQKNNFLILSVAMLLMSFIVSVKAAENPVAYKAAAKIQNHATSNKVNSNSSAKNYAFYINRGISLFKSADKWHDVKAFEKTFPVDQNQFSKILLMIDQGKLESKYKNDKDYLALKKLLLAFKQSVKDFEMAGKINMQETKKSANAFMAANPIYFKLYRAYYRG